VSWALASSRGSPDAASASRMYGGMTVQRVTDEVMASTLPDDTDKRRMSAARDHQGGRDRRDPLTTSGQAESVGRRATHRHRRSRCLGEGGLGLLAARPDLRPVADDLHADVGDVEAGLA